MTILDKIRYPVQCGVETWRYWGGRHEMLVSYWWRSKMNVGDMMGPYVLHHMSGKQVQHIDDLLFVKGRTDVFVSVGSIIQQINFPRPVIWGSGIIDPSRVPVLTDPKIYAVRGPLTRRALLKSGYRCPDQYGDPALLISRFFEKPTERPLGGTNERVGIVLHYSDHAMIEDLGGYSGVNFIGV